MKIFNEKLAFIVLKNPVCLQNLPMVTTLFAVVEITVLTYSQCYSFKSPTGDIGYDGNGFYFYCPAIARYGYKIKGGSKFDELCFDPNAPKTTLTTFVPFTTSRIEPSTFENNFTTSISMVPTTSAFQTATTVTPTGAGIHSFWHPYCISYWCWK